MSSEYKPLGLRIHELREDVRRRLKKAPIRHRRELEHMESYLRSAELKNETLMVLNGESHDPVTLDVDECEEK